MQHDKQMAQQATVILVVGLGLGVLLVLDLINRGLVWRAWRAFRSPNTASMPGEDRTVGESHRTDVTFLM